MSEKIRIILKRKKMTVGDLADKLSTSSQNLSNKLTRNNFSEQELHKIAEALECHFEGYFIFNDNEKI
ncbi:MAG: helix-turn-helix transcriptional regulator [Ruminiclostridium sp.]